MIRYNNNNIDQTDSKINYVFLRSYDKYCRLIHMIILRNNFNETEAKNVMIQVFTKAWNERFFLHENESRILTFLIKITKQTIYDNIDQKNYQKNKAYTVLHVQNIEVLDYTLYRLNTEAEISAIFKISSKEIRLNVRNLLIEFKKSNRL